MNKRPGEISQVEGLTRTYEQNKSYYMNMKIWVLCLH